MRLLVFINFSKIIQFINFPNSHAIWIFLFISHTKQWLILLLITFMISHFNSEIDLNNSLSPLWVQIIDSLEMKKCSTFSWKDWIRNKNQSRACNNEGLKGLNISYLLENLLSQFCIANALIYRIIALIAIHKTIPMF